MDKRLVQILKTQEIVFYISIIHQAQMEYALMHKVEKEYAIRKEA